MEAGFRFGGARIYLRSVGFCVDYLSRAEGILSPRAGPHCLEGFALIG